MHLDQNRSGKGELGGQGLEQAPFVGEEPWDGNLLAVLGRRNDGHVEDLVVGPFVGDGKGHDGGEDGLPALSSDDAASGVSRPSLSRCTSKTVGSSHWPLRRK